MERSIFDAVKRFASSAVRGLDEVTSEILTLRSASAHLPPLSKRLENAIVVEITHCTVETNGIRVHYVEQGTGR